MKTTPLDPNDISGRAAATTRIRAMERAGIFELEEQLKKMRADNVRARQCSDEPLWTDDEIEDVEREIAEKRRAL